jgi:hypothetical protein
MAAALGGLAQKAAKKAMNTLAILAAGKIPQLTECRFNGFCEIWR